MDSQSIVRLRDLRPGDIMFGPIGGAVGLGVGLGQVILGEGFRVGRLSIRHVGIVTKASVQEVDGEAWSRPLLVQAMPGGAEEVEMIPEGHWTDRHAFVRLPEEYAGQGLDAAAVARLMVQTGVAYSWASYLSLAGWRFGFRPSWLGEWINRRRPPLPFPGPVGDPFQDVQLPVEAICSVLVDQAWTLAGKRVMEGVRPQAVTPGALADQLLSYPEATWVRPTSVPGVVRRWTV
jgi:hypothetical protein